MIQLNFLMFTKTHILVDFNNCGCDCVNFKIIQFQYFNYYYFLQSYFCNFVQSLFANFILQLNCEIHIWNYFRNIYHQFNLTIGKPILNSAALDYSGYDLSGFETIQLQLISKYFRNSRKTIWTCFTSIFLQLNLTIV